MPMPATRSGRFGRFVTGWRTSRGVFCRALTGWRIFMLRLARIYRRSRALQFDLEAIPYVDYERIVVGWLLEVKAPGLAP